MNTSSEKSKFDPNLTWEYLKYEIRKFSIHYSSTRAKTLKSDKIKHEEIVKNYKANPSQCSEDSYKTSKIWLEKWYDDYTEGIMIRSKSNWFEKGEKSTKFFLNLEKSNYLKNTIRNICVNKENPEKFSKEPKEILDHVRSFYENLFERKCNKSTIQSLNFLNTIKNPTFIRKFCRTLREIF